MLGYDETIRCAGYWDASDRTSFDIGGKDRVRMLHAFCTADIQQLAVGQGTEAFVLNPKGKTLALIRVVALPDRLAIDTDPNLGPTLIAHLDKYVIVEQVSFEDRTQERTLVMLAGPAANQLIDEYFDFNSANRIDLLPMLGMRVADLGGHELRIQRRNDYSLDCFGIEMPPEFTRELLPWLIDRGVAACSDETVETLRIEQGTPQFGTDFSDDTLPQELQRDALAISFKKGCYLGQETVARIDALGHVNRLLVGVKLPAGDDARAGTLLTDGEGKQIGTITCVATSPRVGCRIGLATVKRGHHRPGSVCLLAERLKAQVVGLPFEFAANEA